MQEIDNAMEAGDPAKESVPWFNQMMEPVNDWLTKVETPIFEQILDVMRPFNQWMNHLPPIVWKLSAVGLFVISALAALCIPRSYIFASAPDNQIWRDLRLWTVVALLPYMAIYYFL